MPTLSVIIKAAAKLSVISLAFAIAFLVERAVTHTVGPLAWWVAAMVVMMLAIVVLSYFDTFVSHDISFKIIKMLRDKVYGHMDKIAPGGLEGKNSADLSMMILADINVFEWFYAHCLVEWLGTFDEASVRSFERLGQTSETYLDAQGHFAGYDGLCVQRGSIEDQFDLVPIVSREVPRRMVALVPYNGRFELSSRRGHSLLPFCQNGELSTETNRAAVLHLFGDHRNAPQRGLVVVFDGLGPL